MTDADRAVAAMDAANLCHDLERMLLILVGQLRRGEPLNAVAIGFIPHTKKKLDELVARALPHTD